VLDLYIRENFSATLAYKKLLGVLQVFIEAEVATKMQGDDLLRVMKSLHYIFKFIVRSRQLYTALDDSACPDDFDSKLQGVLFSMANLMKRNEDFVLLAQGACLKYIPCAIPELITVFNIQDLRLFLWTLPHCFPLIYHYMEFFFSWFRCRLDRYCFDNSFEFTCCIVYKLGYDE